jgi:heptaprenyl diphosphate synthase
MIRISNEILDWAITYLAADNESIKRPKGSQAVCPFVKASIDNDTFLFAFHPEVNGTSETHLEELMVDYIETFKKTGPFRDGDTYKKTLIVVFPYIRDEDSYILDVVHKNVKDQYVVNDLMIGQFHPNCDDRGVYNRQFKVSMAPYCLFSIRQMALHDILFLRDKKEWFLAYNAKYGAKFKKDELDENNNHLEEYYLMAKRKYLVE